MLSEVRANTGLPIVTEVMDTRQVELVASYADVLQIGARNMQNFSLLSEVGRLRRPVLLKRGMSATLKDLLLAADYVMSEASVRSPLQHETRSTWPRFRSSSARRIYPWWRIRLMRVAEGIWWPRSPTRQSRQVPMG